ncbi:tetratricopeptide repeat protein [Candidatus Uabimicrobium amorphum]|uniref:PatA-like N-terminal domain-containing protein n=1 Tax=Uabimicrobium amorphum TaxID=2596890 RepID=A0A5S9F577_UABAM|nr:tetratricopeptide repeat protein [Candidatus Uabimicrobium amorphum]BBM85264.1 hypothetical protein UABAM_03627 [Candidatus Uabimicrobium amorphum]
MSEGSKKVGIEIIGLSGVLQDLQNNRRTTILYAYSNDHDKEKYVYFKEGLIKLVTSPNRSSVLAEGLQRAFNLVDDETLSSAFQEQLSSGKHLTTVLREIGADDNFIVDVCGFQISEEIYDLFLWEDLQIELIDDIDHEKFPEELLALPIAIEVDFLLMEAARRSDEWKKITGILPSGKDVAYISEDIYDDNLTAEIMHILSLLDSVHDFDEIIKDCRISEFHAWEIFAQLYEAGYIALRTAEELKELASLDEFSDDLFKRIKLYERAEELGDNSIETITWLAEAYQQGDLINKAVRKYKQLGEQYVELEQYDGAIRAYKEVLDVFQDDMDAHEKYIDALFKKGNFQDGAKASITYSDKLSIIDKRRAILALENAYQHNPLSPEVLEKMAKLYCDLSETVDAMFTYTTVANLYKSRGLYQDTIDAYHKILELDYANIEARIKLADTYLIMGQHDKGIAEYKHLGDILTDAGFSDNPFTYTYLINICEKIIEFEPTNLSAREWLADTYIFKKEYDKAKEVLVDLLSFLENANNPEELLSILQKLVEIEPQNRSYLKKLAHIYKRLNLFDDAARDFIHTGEICLNEASKQEMAGKADDARRLQEEALEAFNEVLTMNPFDLEIRQKRAELLHKLNHVESAIEEYKLICHMTKAVNNYHDALTALFHIVELAPEHDPSAFLDMAKLCERQNKNDLAINFYKKYAIFNLEKGDLGEVMQSCRRLSILSPGDEEVKKWRDLVSYVMKG